MKCVCSLFILVLVVQIVHTKKPRLTSKQNREQIYVGTVGHCPGGHHHRFPISLIWGRLCLPHHLNHSFYLIRLWRRYLQVKNCFSDHDFGRFTQNSPRQECSKSLVNGRIPKIQRHSVKVYALNYPILVYLFPRAFPQPQLMSRNQGHRNEFV